MTEPVDTSAQEPEDGSGITATPPEPAPAPPVLEKVTFTLEYTDRTITITTSGRIVESGVTAQVHDPSEFLDIVPNPTAIPSAGRYAIVSVILNKVMDDANGEFYKIQVKEK
jgi:hypothetical protein